MTFQSPTEKQKYVINMFSRIAHRYDLMNRIMTGGQDKHWRKLLIQQAQLPPQGKLLDIATGTGDIAFEALQQCPNLSHIVGADFTLPMIGLAQQRGVVKKNTGALSQVNTVQLSWSGADTLHLPFLDNSFDAVVSGFLMRNVTNIPLALAEQRRVCKIGGRVLILEIPRPPDNLSGKLFRLYFHHVTPFVGGLITGQRDAYSYLPASADAFLCPDELKVEMEKIGLRQISCTMLMLNTVALHLGIK